MSQVKSEDQYGLKWDKFISNSLIKMSMGAAIGGAFSLLLFRRRMFPIHLGVGTGFGFATCDFQHELNRK